MRVAYYCCMNFHNCLLFFTTVIKTDRINSNSKTIVARWQSRIYDFTMTLFIIKLPYFCFRTEKCIRISIFDVKFWKKLLHSPPRFSISTNDNSLVSNCKRSMIITTFHQIFKSTPLIFLELCHNPFSIITADNVCCIWCRSCRIMPDWTYDKLNHRSGTPGLVTSC